MARAVAGNSIKDNKALEMFLLPMASQKKCHVCCCKSSSRWYSVVDNFVEDVKNCFHVETSCNDACLCASCRRNLTRWWRSCDEQREKYFVKAQSRGNAFVNKITLAQQDRRRRKKYLRNKSSPSIVTAMFTGGRAVGYFQICWHRRYL